ncbi:hypothetical protein DL1_00495 [Thioclava dalianensis]|uniref:Response regulatory domain-containing protein n=2 Tax=Thioclava dalianensis TaxID=1185766 RepID=A0A074TS91_9RHOB|nr:hypothetical protein [Thioclava dalianensis]KEP71768.1 hypothetical protein DL1_00495 [Thioclava dalianensis]SFN45435.1 hypothetical protein SAMN05216224_105285 [Thioclava dalianensis]
MSEMRYSKQALRAVFLHSKAIGEARKLLLVEAEHELPLALHGVAGLEIRVIELDLVTREEFAEFRPDLVLAPLLTARFDILDLAQRLEAIGYTGALRAYCKPLPNARVVLAEVKNNFPKLDFAIFEVPVVNERDN